MACKLTFFYNGNDDGWTETWYHGGTDPFAVINGIPVSLYTNSTAFRAPNVDLFAVRATLLGTGVRTSWTLPLAGKFTSPNSPNQGGNAPDAPQVDALYKMLDGLGHSHKTFFRGLMDAQTNWTGSGIPIQNAALIQGIGKFILSMYNASFQLRYSTRPPANGNNWFTVLNVGPATALGFPQFAFVQTTQAPNLVLTGPYPPIIFQGVNRNLLPGFPLTTYVIAQSNVAPFGIVIPYLYRNTGIFAPTKNMRWCVQTYQYSQLFTGVFQRFTNHKTGRSFGVPRGRARSVVRSN